MKRFNFSRRMKSDNGPTVSRRSALPLRYLCATLALLFSLGQVWADSETYTFTSKSWAATNSASQAANWTSGKDGGQLTSGQGIQVTTGATGANGTSPISFDNVSSVVVRYCTNASKGAGTIKVQVGTGTEKSFTVTKPSSGGTTLKDAAFNFDPTETGNVKVTVDCSANSIYIYSVTITYTPAGGGSTPTLTGITVTGDLATKTYETTDHINLSGLVATGTYSEGDPQNITDDVTWTVSATAADGSYVSPETFTLTAGMTQIYVMAELSGVKTEIPTVITGLNVTFPQGDLLTLESTGVTSGTYVNWSDVAGVSGMGAVYAGNSANGNDAIQLRSKDNSGIVSTTSGGLIKKVKVEWNSNTDNARTLQVYGSNTAYTSPADLYDASKKGALIGTITN